MKRGCRRTNRAIHTEDGWAVVRVTYAIRATRAIRCSAIHFTSGGVRDKELASGQLVSAHAG